MSDELPAPSDYDIPAVSTTNTHASPDYDIPVITNTDTHVYDLPVVTTDISMNTNPAYATTKFGEPQQPDTSPTYVNVVSDRDYML